MAEAIRSLGSDPADLVRADVGVLDVFPLTLDEACRISPPELIMICRCLTTWIERQAAVEAGRGEPYPYELELQWLAGAGAHNLASAMAIMQIFSEAMGLRSRAVTAVHRSPWTRLVLPGGTMTSPVLALAEFNQLVMLDRLLCWLAGSRIPGIRFEMSAAEGMARHVPSTLSTRELVWSAPETALALPSGAEDLPNVRSAGEVTAIAPLAPLLFAEGPGTPSAAKAVRMIDEAIEAGIPVPTLGQLAKASNCSEATLRRRLTSEGVSLQRLKAERRHAWAVALLSESRLSLAEIGYRLGYSDESAFRRAFHAWTGETPSRFQAGVEHVRRSRSVRRPYT